ncbi:uncharacterized protein LOC126176643 [Schistocerca cancellata]|uniref:uncharacterized protein LOC126176643 n=1 Tax=Schistocerca cancellata TaxID=274614 RepID=UPI002117EAB5|nr:uncharacterized protein LOC126176643 [Schistocerca cancellata]
MQTRYRPASLDSPDIPGGASEAARPLSMGTASVPLWDAAYLRHGTAPRRGRGRAAQKRPRTEKESRQVQKVAAPPASTPTAAGLIRTYSCTCIDYSIKLNMCKHIHNVCQLDSTEQNPFEISELQDAVATDVGDMSCINEKEVILKQSLTLSMMSKVVVCHGSKSFHTPHQNLTLSVMSKVVVCHGSKSFHTPHQNLTLSVMSKVVVCHGSKSFHTPHQNLTLSVMSKVVVCHGSKSFHTPHQNLTLSVMSKVVVCHGSKSFHTPHQNLTLSVMSKVVVCHGSKSFHTPHQDLSVNEFITVLWINHESMSFHTAHQGLSVCLCDTASVTENGSNTSNMPP